MSRFKETPAVEQKSKNNNKGNMKTEKQENGNGSLGSDGMTNEEINRLADEGASLLSFEKYCEQVLFGDSRQMKLDDKERAWRTYLAYNVKARNDGRKSTFNLEEYVQKAQKMGERTEATWQKFLPLKVESLEAITDWIKEGLWLQRSRTKEAFTAWKNGAARVVGSLFPSKDGDGADTDGMSAEEVDAFYLRPVTGDFPAPARAEAFYGIAGEVTKIICEGTELMPEAVLSQFLCIVGNMMGHGLHKNQEGRHSTVINLAVVGSTANGAKGGSLRAVKLLIRNIDSTYSFEKLRGGHNSPEALLAEICDEVTGLGEEGPTIVEAEIPDKRLVVVEEELTRLFAVNNRNGSGMSEMLRLFYDAPSMVAAPSRRSKLASTCPHVSVLGHVTPEGLKHSMPTVEVFNGLANRFMYIASQRTASIPEPADVDWSREDLNLKVQYLQKVVREFHPNEESITNPEFPFIFTASGKSKWYELYHQYSAQAASKSGMAGAMVARSKATVLRLAMIYAGLDLTQEIQKEHFEAAAALWEYSLASVKWAFGENSGNPNADKIIAALRRAGKKGMTRTEISEVVFNRRESSHNITEALSVLKREKKAGWKPMPNPAGKGRKLETWFDINSITSN